MPEMSATHSLEPETRLPEPALALPDAVQNHAPQAPRQDDLDLDPELTRLEALLYARTRQAYSSRTNVLCLIPRARLDRVSLASSNAACARQRVHASGRILRCAANTRREVYDC